MPPLAARAVVARYPMLAEPWRLAEGFSHLAPPDRAVIHILMPDDEVRFDASTPDAAAVSLAELVAEVGRLAASIGWQHHGLLLAKSTMNLNPELAAKLPTYQQRLDDTEARLRQAKGELAKGFAWIAKGTAAR